MRKIALVLILFSILAGCTSSTASQQAAGVLQALAALPPAPIADPAVQQQIAGWQAWAAYLAPLVQAIGGVK